MEAIVLMIGAMRHFAWRFVPYEDMGMVSKGLNGVTTLLLLLLLHRHFNSRLMFLVILWWMWEEVQVILCSFWYVLKPWNVPEGVPICSAKAGFDIGAFSLAIMAVLILKIVRSYSSANPKDETK